MDTESPRSRRIAVSTFVRLLIALVIVGTVVSVDPAQSNSSKVAPALRSFWVSRTGTDVTINNLRTGATVVVSCKKGCKGSEKIKVGKRTKVKSKLLTKALSAGRAARIRVQETKRGFVGVWKIAVISRRHALRTLPSPIKVYCMAPRTKACGVKKIAKPAVVSHPPSVSTAPTISGTARQGQILTASQGSWTNSPISYAYQWRRCGSSGSSCSDILGATTSAYALVYDDVVSTIRVAVTAKNTSGSASATSTQTAVVSGLPPASTALPTISGTSKQGQLLTVSNGSWDNSPPTSYAFRWQRCDSSGSPCSVISSANANAYTLVSDDVGKTIRVETTASNSYGSGSATSAQTAVVVTAAPVNTAPPTISGTSTESWTLSASNGSWDNSPPTSYTFQWQRCLGSSCSDISGATTSTHALVSDDVGKTIRVETTASNSYGSGSAISAQTAVIAQATSFLTSEQTLIAGQYLVSPLRKYALTMQIDGNLVITKISDGSVPWSAGTAGNPGAWAVMQGDGSFCVYKADSNVLLWNAAATGGNWGAYIELQDDGNLVMYSSTGVKLWSRF